MKDDFINNIGTRIAEIRRSNKATQEEVADHLGVSPKHISHVENATSCLSLKNLIQFCKLYDCSLDYLVFGKGSNEALSKLPEDIVKILNTGSKSDIELINRYLQIYLELKNKQD